MKHIGLFIAAFAGVAAIAGVATSPAEANGRGATVVMSSEAGPGR
jgi:hypothetical protein